MAELEELPYLAKEASGAAGTRHDPREQLHVTLAKPFEEVFTIVAKTEGSVGRELDPRAAARWLLSLLASQGFRTATMPDRRRLEAELAAISLQTLTTDPTLDTKRAGKPTKR